MLDNRQQVLAALDRLQNRLVHREEWSLSAALGSLKEALQSPLFGRVLTLQHSVRQLQQQVRNGSAPDGAPAAVDPGGGEGRFSLGGVVVVTATCAAGLSRFCSQGRRIEPIVLTRPASGGLGFSVVGLNPAGSGGHGVFVKHIQPGGIAGRDGRLQEQDQILNQTRETRTCMRATTFGSDFASCALMDSVH
uniref:PDZ domain-containing protein n=1 Tax=Poecilia latipinna TaxID=48699 RepID=A0A3B3VPX6_9TELE